jgi:hypothetical protein
MSIRRSMAREIGPIGVAPTGPCAPIAEKAAIAVTKAGGRG